MTFYLAYSDHTLLYNLSYFERHLIKSLINNTVIPEPTNGITWGYFDPRFLFTTYFPKIHNCVPEFPVGIFHDISPLKFHFAFIYHYSYLRSHSVEVS